MSHNCDSQRASLFVEAREKSWEVRGIQSNRIENIAETLTEVCTESPGQALTLFPEDGPNFVGRALSEILARSLGVQDFRCRPP